MKIKTKTALLVTICLLIFISFSLIINAENYVWTGDGDNNLWSNPENWSQGQVPGERDAISLNPPPIQGPVIENNIQSGSIEGPVWDSDSNQIMEINNGKLIVDGIFRFANGGKGTAKININNGEVQIKGDFRWSDSSDSNGIVNLTEFSRLTCNNLLIGDEGGGEIHVSGNSYIQINESLKFGGARGESNILLKIDGGLVRVNDVFECPSNEQRAGKITVQLNAGRLEIGEFDNSGVAYSLDLAEGIMLVSGNVVSKLQGDIDKGYITAFNGEEEVSIEYDSEKDQTILMAKNRQEGRSPTPSNWGQNINIDQKLTWRPGKNAHTYNIYFGTSKEAVAEDATPVKENHPSTEYQIDLDFDQTYYWRIETVTEDDRKLPGNTWQFKTITGQPKNLTPETVNLETELEWKSVIKTESYNVYLDTDPEKVKSASKFSDVSQGVNVSQTSYQPSDLKPGETYYWRIDSVNKDWSQSPVKGEIWSFDTELGIAQNPLPKNDSQWMPTEIKLEWEPPSIATSHKIYFSKNLDEVKGEVEPVEILEKSSYSPGKLEKGTTYYWRVDEIFPDDQVYEGNVWSFSTEKELGGLPKIKVDLAVPQWDPPHLPIPESAKKGWIIWSAPRWKDMYMHDQVWLPDDKMYTWEDGSWVDRSDEDGILNTGVRIYIAAGGTSLTGAVHAKGMGRGGLAGDLQPKGKPEGEPIANTYHYACDWAGPVQGDTVLLIENLPPGEYKLKSYHNFWEPTKQSERNWREAKSIMPPMPSITVHSLALINELLEETASGKPLDIEGEPYLQGLNLPEPSEDDKVNGVKAIENAYDVPVTSVLEDKDVSTSVVRFETDGSSVIVIYEATGWEYKDRARSGREGGRGVLNAFELMLESSTQEE